MSDVEIALLRGGLVVLALITSIDFEKRTGEIPNLVPLASLLAALAAGAYTGTFYATLGGTMIVGLPAVLAYTRTLLRPDAAKLAIGLGACLGLVGGGVTLVLGALWVWALAGRKAEWKRLQRPMPRVDAAPRMAVLAAAGALSGLALAIAS